MLDKVIHYAFRACVLSVAIGGATLFGVHIVKAIKKELKKNG